MSALPPKSRHVQCSKGLVTFARIWRQAVWLTHAVGRRERRPVFGEFLARIGCVKSLTFSPTYTELLADRRSPVNGLLTNTA
jgi:hypothetical protein